jgi:hypothetical protein
MKTLPVKEQHQAELKYLMGEISFLQRMGADTLKIADAVRAFSYRHRELYPELDGAQVALSLDCKTQDVFESEAEFKKAILAQAKAQKECPYVSSRGKSGDYNVLGPKKK